MNQNNEDEPGRRGWGLRCMMSARRLPDGWLELHEPERLECCMMSAASTPWRRDVSCHGWRSSSLTVAHIWRLGHVKDSLLVIIYAD